MSSFPFDELIFIRGVFVNHQPDMFLGTIERPLDWIGGNLDCPKKLANKVNPPAQREGAPLADTRALFGDRDKH